MMSGNYVNSIHYNLEIGIWGMYYKKGSKHQLNLSQFKMIKRKFDDFKQK
jgi:hypothetical protein